MMEIKDEVFFEQLVKEVPIVLVLFGSNTCMPCVSLKEKMKQLENQIACVYVPVEEALKLAASKQVFCAPTMQVYVMGKLTVKYSGTFSFEEVCKQVNRYQTLIQ